MANKIERREFVKRAAYAAPVILTLKAMPAFAAAGSGKHETRRGEGKGLPADKGTAGTERSHPESGGRGDFETPRRRE